MSFFSNNLLAGGQSNGAPQAVVDYASASKSVASGGFKWSMNNKALAPMQEVVDGKENLNENSG